MNENINLVEILKDCPKGCKFWSPLLGDVKFNCIYKDFGERCVIECEREKDVWKFNIDGTVTIGNIPSQTIMLYPSKDQRDWSRFKPKQPKFNPNTLNPFDKVLARDGQHYRWRCAFYSHEREEECTFKYETTDSIHKYCIPYNNDTKHLVGTTEEAPEYYRYWED